MPAVYTHYKFGKDVLKNLNNNQITLINSNVSYYYIWNQGWDNLYYHLNWKYYKTIGKNAHKKNINEFFCNLITYIKDNQLENDAEIINILYGFINHYILDTIMHPYINYQVKNTNISHTKIEYIIDNMLFKNENNYGFNANNFKLLIPTVKFSKNIKNCLNYIFDKTHNIKNIANAINLSHNNSYYLYRYIIFDKIGVKTLLYKFIDLITFFIKTKIHKCTYRPQDFNETLLNINNVIWHHPKNNKEIYNYSLEDLYDYSLNIAIITNKLIYDILNNNKTLEEFSKLINSINIKNIPSILKI